MTANYTRGHDARRAQALALRLELGLPVRTPVSPSVTFASVTGFELPVLEGMARKAAEDGRDCVVSIYEGEGALTPSWYLLLYREKTQVLARKVVPAAPSGEGPIVLMSQDRKRQFAIDRRGVLQDLPIQAATKRSRAHRGAAERLAATAEAVGPILCTEASRPGDVTFDENGNVVTAAAAAA